MPIDVRQTALVRWLEANNSIYFGKSLELRNEIAGWLAYVPHTFPHYTRHTIDHSESIILQLSKVLFRNDNLNSCTINLSATEAYILVAAAYLHDAGMVASDAEKKALLEDEDWRKWVTGEGGAAERWNEIEKFRMGDHPANGATRNFVADLETRFLLAEFVRRIHHERAANVIQQHQSSLGRFAFDDPELETAISEICVGHGLRREMLDDRVRYPLLRQIRGDDVNVRLLAILFRLGDLLDLQSDRACPLLLNAACPLPAESYAHWSQYRQIRHRAVSPDVIELRAECMNSEEHRVLRDWCQWIVDEVAATPALLAGSLRHADWHPPRASMFGNSPTIQILPAPAATYYARDWRFELNEQSIFQRLIADVYDEPNIFIRELIQNSLDAMRCRIYEDLTKAGENAPTLPTRIKKEIRDKYKLQIRIWNSTVENKMSGENEERATFEINDCGIGMDEEIITKHLLQVGKSFYTTSEFRRRYKFVPTSQFGIGFLSVFAVSDQIKVETYREANRNTGEAIKLVFSGPRNYVIVERGTRRKLGTSVSVQLNLNRNFRPGEVTGYIRDICPLVEFPIEVDDFGDISLIEAEISSNYLFKVEDYSEEGGVFELKSYKVLDEEVEGDLFFLIHRNKNGIEDWTRMRWYRNEYLKHYPYAEVPKLPHGMTCFHGIWADRSTYPFVGLIEWRDYRGSQSRTGLSREHVFLGHYGRRVDSRPRAFQEHLIEILNEHIDREGKHGDWEYLQRLADVYPIEGEFWAKKPNMIPMYSKGSKAQTSFAEFCSFQKITELMSRHAQVGLGGSKYTNVSVPDPKFRSIERAITRFDLSRLCDDHASNLFSGRKPSNPRFIGKHYFSVDWSLDDGWSSMFVPTSWRFSSTQVFSCEFADEWPVVIYVERNFRSHDYMLFNVRNSMAKWLIRIFSRTIAVNLMKFNTQLEQWWDLIHNVTRYEHQEISSLNKYLNDWRKIQNLPLELQPPMGEFPDIKRAFRYVQ